MNEQNNNINSQLDLQNQSVPDSSTQTPKPRFFSPELFQDSDAHSVGSSVSNHVNNHVINWEVGQKNTESVPVENSVTSNSSINPSTSYQEQLLEQVNGVIYTDEQPEILDDSFLEEATPPQYNLQNSPLFQETSVSNNSSVNTTSSDMESPASVASPASPTPIPSFNGEDWMSQQPLSAASLGVGVQNASNEIKEVEEQNRFFQPNGVVQTPGEQQMQYVMQQGNGIQLDDPAPVIDEKQLVRDYVGVKYTKLSMSPFNFSAFLFGSCYYIYRKMYFLGILLYIGQMAILKFVSFPVSSIAILVLSIVVGLVTNPFYLKLAEKKVKGIVKKNKDKNQLSLSTICKKKGGTSIVMFLLFIVVYSSIISFLSYATIFPKIMDFLSSSFSLVQKENDQLTENSFDGNILYEAYAIEDLFEISIPTGFQKDEGEIFKYFYETENHEKYNSCTLTFGKVYGFSSSEELIQEIASYENVKDKVGSVVTNGVHWDTLSIEGEFSNTHYRSTVVGDDVLLLQYDSGIHTPVGVCDTYLVDILESLQLKEE